MTESGIGPDPSEFDVVRTRNSDVAMLLESRPVKVKDTHFA